MKASKDSASEQAKLAMALVDSLGLEGAMRACRANGWDGVLEILNGPAAPRLPEAQRRIYKV